MIVTARIPRIPTTLERVVMRLFDAAGVCWVLLFVGLLASFFLLFVKQANGTAAAVAGAIFLSGSAGFVVSMLSAVLLSALPANELNRRAK